MKAHFDIPKMPGGLINITAVREDGARLSLAADDSCGVASSYIRTYLKAFDSHDFDFGPEQQAISPEQYLRALADFLGFDVIERS